MAQRRYVDESILMDADVDKRPEIRDIRHDDIEDHARFEVFDLGHAFVEFRRFELGSRVASGFLKLVDDISKRHFAHVVALIRIDRNLLRITGISDEISHGNAHIFRNFFDE